MDITLLPRRLSGTLPAIPSKSQAHRLLICAAFADAPTLLRCPDTNRDIDATASCLRALGAGVTRLPEGYRVEPVRDLPASALLDCGESGSTLRFLLPVVGALGVDSTFQLSGRLPQRPVSPLWEEMERMGCRLSRPTGNTLRCTGKLRTGAYAIDGGVSSQFVSGLLFGLSLPDGHSTLEVTGSVESAPYIRMTEQAMKCFGMDPANLGGGHFHSPGDITVEGDWSNAAFFLAAAAMGNPVSVTGLRADSCQGDRAVTDILPLLEAGSPTIPAGDIPDLVPILAVAAGSKHGCTFTHVHRLRLKESDRVAAVAAMLRVLGGTVEIGEDTLTVSGTGFTGGTVDAQGDHRIAMAAAIAATVCTAPVTILGAQAVEKSYPSFWAEYCRLGGKEETL